MSRLFLLLILFSMMSSAYAVSWPQTFSAEGATITLYEPQPEKFAKNILEGIGAVSMTTTRDTEPVFGAIWFRALMSTDKMNRTVVLESITITDVKFPEGTDPSRIQKLTQILETEIPKRNFVTSLDELLTALEETEQQQQQSDQFNNNPPQIIYTNKPSLLVSIDGQPILQQVEKSDFKRVVNSAFLILQDPDDKKFYLAGGEMYFVSASIDSGWSYTQKPPSNVKKTAAEFLEGNDTSIQKTSEGTIPEIVVTTSPTELIQTKGDANYVPMDGTNLLYAQNSENDLIKNIGNQTNYVLLSGRWYISKSLNGPWNYLSADSLPSDFAKIPPESPVGAVLVSVPGTPQAKDALMEAQVPQTAKVDRKTATTKVTYDGDPKFDAIQGTDLSVAVNSPQTVLRSGSNYYCVDNGVWFIAKSPEGPWSVATDRPQDVDKIPADNQAYNVKYVYIYDYTPSYVYCGYTWGYTGCYIYGPTVVYGTGWYYRPWYGAYYYPRPVTYGYSMRYAPYYGWSFGFSVSVGMGGYYGGHYGYWGPPAYRPPYYGYRGGYAYRGNPYNNKVKVNRNQNIYNNYRHGVSTKDIKVPSSNRPAQPTVRPANPSGSNRLPGQPGTRPAIPVLPSQPPTRPANPSGNGIRPTQPSQPGTRPMPSPNQPGTRPVKPPVTGKPVQPNQPGTRPAVPGRQPGTRPVSPPSGQTKPSTNNVYSDRSGNIYRQQNGQWQQRVNQNKSWQTPANGGVPRQLNQSSMDRSRGVQNSQNFQRLQAAPRTNAPPKGGKK